MPKNIDHVWLIFIAFVATLACFTAISIVGSDGGTVLRDILFALVGGLTGVAVAKRASE